jgi:hypothetical protein
MVWPSALRADIPSTRAPQPTTLKFFPQNCAEANVLCSGIGVCEGRMETGCRRPAAVEEIEARNYTQCLTKEQFNL